MLDQRTLRASGEVVPDSLLDVRTRLVSDGILNEVPTRLRASGSPPLVYSHHILFDYAIAALVLASDGESRLTRVLDEDPNFVLVARPSIDLHLADLWHSEPTRTLFGAVVFALARHRCVLAGVAAARVLASEVASLSDVAWLTPPGDDEELDVVILGWIAGVMEAADEADKQRIRDMNEVWVELVGASTRLVAHVFQDHRAGQAGRMLRQLHRLQPMRPGLPGASTWADCVAALTSVVLVNPEQRGWLGTRLAQLLPWAVAIAPGRADVLLLTLRPKVLEHWPPNYLHHYIDNIGLIATGAAEAARDVLFAVLRFDETREDVTALTEGVMTLTSTRRQDVTSVKYAVGQHMADFIAVAGLPAATAVLATALQALDEEFPGDTVSYPVRTPTAVGHVDQFVSSLEYSQGHGAAEEIVKAYAHGLSEFDTVTVDLFALVDDLVESIHHPEAWRHILTAVARRPVDLGLAFLPVIASGGLLVHSDTRAAAGTFIQATSPVLPPAEHLILEQAILAAPGLLLDPTEDRTARILDQLAGRLEPDRIQHPDLAIRADALLAGDGPPEIPEPIDMETTWVADTLPDQLSETEYGQLSDSQRETIDALRSAVDATANNATPEQVPLLENALRAVFDADIIGENLAGAIALLVLRGIAILVRGFQLDPGSDLAAVAMPILLETARETGEPTEGVA